jgi:hypothetical protein
LDGIGSWSIKSIDKLPVDNIIWFVSQFIYYVFAVVDKSPLSFDQSVKYPSFRLNDDVDPRSGSGLENKNIYYTLLGCA